MSYNTSINYNISQWYATDVFQYDYLYVLLFLSFLNMSKVTYDQPKSSIKIFRYLKALLRSNKGIFSSYTKELGYWLHSLKLFSL